jgi:hypothetical protein
MGRCQMRIKTMLPEAVRVTMLVVGALEQLGILISSAVRWLQHFMALPVQLLTPI